MAGNAFVSIEIWLVLGAILDLWVFVLIVAIVILKLTERYSVVDQVIAAQAGLECSVGHLGTAFVSVGINSLLRTTGSTFVGIIVVICSIWA